MRAKKESFATFRIAIGLLGLVTLVAANGCGDGKITRYPVTGTVLVDDKPAEGVQVIFIPVEGSDEFMRERPAGYSGPDGTFQLTTFGTDDGAPAGDYQVMLRWFVANPQSAPAERDDRQARAPTPDRLGGRYANPEQTGLKATIPRGGGEIPPFELKSK